MAFKTAICVCFFLLQMDHLSQYFDLGHHHTTTNFVMRNLSCSYHLLDHHNSLHTRQRMNRSSIVPHIIIYAFCPILHVFSESQMTRGTLNLYTAIMHLLIRVVYFWINLLVSSHSIDWEFTQFGELTAFLTALLIMVNYMTFVLVTNQNRLSIYFDSCSSRITQPYSRVRNWVPLRLTR